MKIINLFVAALFLASISACLVKVDSNGKYMLVEDDTTKQLENIVEDNSAEAETQSARCLRGCDGLCEKIQKCEADTCTEVCSVIESAAIVCGEPKIIESSGPADPAAYATAKKAIVTKCDVLKTAAEKDMCYKVETEEMLKQDFAQIVKKETIVAGPCNIIGDEYCKPEITKVQVDEVTCKSLKTTYSTKYEACKKIDPAKIVACIKDLDAAFLANIDAACAFVEKTEQVCNQEILPFNKAVLSCSQTTAEVCTTIDKTACQKASDEFATTVKTKCGAPIEDPKNTGYEAYLKCYKETKASVLGPVCNSKCTTATVNEYKADRKQITALDIEAAINDFVDSFFVEPVCTVAAPAAPPAPAAPACIETHDEAKCAALSKDWPAFALKTCGAQPDGSDPVLMKKYSDCYKPLKDATLGPYCYYVCQ